MKLFTFAELNPVRVILLEEKRPLLIDELVQYHTYRSLLVGVPEDRHTEELPATAMENAKSRFGASPEPVVIAPTLHSFSIEQQQHLREPGGDFEPTGESFNRIGRRLPKVTCIASLRCPLPLVEPEKDAWFSYSRGTVIWFQENFAFPIDAEVMAQIRALDWNAVAIDTSD